MSDALTVAEYEDDGRKATALTTEEVAICQNVVVFGIEYLTIVKGWPVDKTRRFMAKVEVLRQVEYLQRQYLDRGGLQERTQFFAQLKINSFVPAALGVLARALAGTQVTEDGTVKSRAPDRGQFDAALEVLSRANIQGGKFAGNNALPSIDARTVNVNVDGSALTGLDPKQRKRVTGILSKVVEHINAQGRADQVLAEHAQRPVADDDDAAAPPASDEAPARPALRRRPSPHDDDPRDRG